VRIGRRRLVYSALALLALFWLVLVYKRANEFTLIVVNQTGAPIRELDLVNEGTGKTLGHFVRLDVDAEKTLVVSPFLRVQLSFQGPDDREHWVSLHRADWTAVRHTFHAVLTGPKVPPARITSQSLWPLWEDRRMEVRYDLTDALPPESRWRPSRRH
jgi:hypothetical protein